MMGPQNFEIKLTIVFLRKEIEELREGQETLRKSIQGLHDSMVTRFAEIKDLLIGALSQREPGPSTKQDLSTLEDPSTLQGTTSALYNQGYTTTYAVDPLALTPNVKHEPGKGKGIGYNPDSAKPDLVAHLRTRLKAYTQITDKLR